MVALLSTASAATFTIEGVGAPKSDQIVLVQQALENLVMRLDLTNVVLDQAVSDSNYERWRAFVYSADSEGNDLRYVSHCQAMSLFPRGDVELFSHIDAAILPGKKILWSERDRQAKRGRSEVREEAAATATTPRGLPLLPRFDWELKTPLKVRRGKASYNPNSGNVIVEGEGVVATLHVEKCVTEPQALQQLVKSLFLQPGEAPVPRPLFPAGEPELRVVSGDVRNAMLKLGTEKQQLPPLFVLPSQLNACEFPADNLIIEEVDDYKYDRTGGPIGQLTAHPAIAQALLNLGATERRSEGFHGLQEVKLPREWKVKNGYLSFPAQMSEKSLEAWTVSASQTSLLIAENAVLGGLSEVDSFNDADPKGTVAMAYASAAPVNTYLNEDKGELDRQKAASAVLVAVQYLTALQYAAKSALQAGVNVRRTVVLMPLGVGVFQNEKKDMTLALAWAWKALSPEQRGVLDAQLLCWKGSATECDDFERLFGA